MTRKHALKAFMALLWQEHRKALALGSLLAASTGIMGLLLLGISGWFIAATSLAGATVATAVVFDVFTPSASIRLLALGRTFSRYGERIFTHDTTLGITAHLREKLFQRWAQPDTAASLLQRPARLLFRITNDAETLEGFYLRQLVPLTALIGTSLVAVAITAIIHWPLGLALGLFLLATSATVIMLGMKQGLSPSSQRAHAEEALRARIIDSVAGHTENLMAGRIAAQHTRIMAAHHAFEHAEALMARLDRQLAAFIASASAVLLTGLLLWVTALVQQTIITIPVAALIMLLGLAVLEPLNALRRGAAEWGRIRHAASRLMPALNNTAPVPHGHPPTESTAVDIQTVSLAHRPVFSNSPLTLRITTGERVALIGTSGAGKTTLLNLIAKELAPALGTVSAQSSSLMGQHNTVFQGTVRDNLLLAKPDADDVSLWAVLDKVGLKADLVQTNRTLDTRLGEGGLGLSQGQMRRLSLAQQFLRAAPLLLLDEPTENVGAATARIMLEALQALPPETTVLIATHAYREAILANRIIVLENGALRGDYRTGDAAFTIILENLRKDY